MALDTKKDLRNMVIYSIFVRQYSEEGTFEAVRKDLKRIRSLGTDIIWLMPIHPIGEKNRKGSLGSPYAIRDYRAVNPDLGTMDDFKNLVADIHALGMKCIIDVVYNHTSPDSVLASEHPEWFYHKSDGSFGNRIGDWTDIIDLDYTKLPLWDYQIETLNQWASIVDGFRCDVAPLVPLDFWLKARRETAAVNPDCIWLAETVEPDFIYQNRMHNINCLSDAEIYQAFDISYDYDIYFDYAAYLTGSGTLSAYVNEINRQETIYPENYVKLRLLENHDRMRASALVPDEQALRSWTAFMYFQKGSALIYNGQEVMNPCRPDLFEKDAINWETGHDMSEFMEKLKNIKKLSVFTDSSYHVEAAGNDAVIAAHTSGTECVMGIFQLKNSRLPVRVPLPEGDYTDLITERTITVKDNMIQSYGEPVILKTLSND